MDKTSKLNPVPDNWQVSGEGLAYYVAGLDTSISFKGVHPAAIYSKPSVPDNGSSFATLMQSVKADVYRGKTVSLTAFLKCVACNGAVTIWLRADGSEGARNLAFDNLEQRTVNGPITGSTDWVRREVSFQIPQLAESLHFGFFLRGSGVAYAAQFNLDLADAPAVKKVARQTLLDRPSNLNFNASHSYKD